MMKSGRTVLAAVLFFLVFFLGFFNPYFSEALAIPVYKSVDAPFSTGDALSRLLKPDNLIFMKSWFKINEGWVQRSKVIRDLDLSRKAILEKETAVRAKPDASLTPQATIKEKTQVTLTDHADGGWVKVKTETVSGWVLEDFLTPLAFDGGLVMTKAETVLRSQASSKAKLNSHVKIPRGIKLNPLVVTNSWIQVRYQGKIGWLTFDQVFSRVNFATKIQKKNAPSMWLQITDTTNSKGHKYAPRGPWFKTVTGDWLALDDVQGLVTDSTKIIVISDELAVRSLPSLGHSKIKAKKNFGEMLRAQSKKMITWVHGYTRELGSIWWPSYPAGAEDQGHEEKLKTTQDLFSQSIFDLAEHPSEPHFKIVVQNGVYKTLDDKSWQRLKFFGHQNFPVAISPEGEVFVGSYKSLDRGKTFKPYLRWDHVLAKLGARTSFAPQKLRLVKIEFNKRPGKAISDILITLNDGVMTTTKLMSPDGGRHWTHAGEKTHQQSDFSHNLSMNDE